MDRIEMLLENLDFEQKLEGLVKKYKNKKVIFYGAGSFFKILNKNYDLKRLNVIGISDISFLNSDNKKLLDNFPASSLSQTNEYMGYKTISPDKIFEYKPDIVVMTVENDYYIEKYLCEILFKVCKKKFKYKWILEPSLNEKLHEEWIGMEI